MYKAERTIDCEKEQDQINLEIFDRVGDIILDPAFLKTQNVFFSDKMEIFDIDDKEGECKLEYTTVHREYMNILDEHIDAQLKHKFKEENIEEFKATYAQNETTYKYLNPIIHETLYAFVDFE